MAARKSSPARWPRLSLTAWKPSRSSRRTPKACAQRRRPRPITWRTRSRKRVRFGRWVTGSCSTACRRYSSAARCSVRSRATARVPTAPGPAHGHGSTCPRKARPRQAKSNSAASPPHARRCASRAAAAPGPSTSSSARPTRAASSRPTDGRAPARTEVSRSAESVDQTRAGSRRSTAGRDTSDSAFRMGLPPHRAATARIAASSPAQSNRIRPSAAWTARRPRRCSWRPGWPREGPRGSASPGCPGFALGRRAVPLVLSLSKLGGRRRRSRASAHSAGPS